jgi:hypothetical protein
MGDILYEMLPGHRSSDLLLCGRCSRTFLAYTLITKRGQNYNESLIVLLTLSFFKQIIVTVLVVNQLWL